MTEAEFKNEMQHLVEVFGATKFNTARMGQIWEICKKMDRITFARLVRDMAEMRMAPSPRDFRGPAWRHYQSQRPKVETKDYEINCRECFDTGYCYLFREKGQFPLVARCDCKQAPITGPYSSIPLFNQNLSKLFPRTNFNHRVIGRSNLKWKDTAIDNWIKVKDYSKRFWENYFNEEIP